MPQIPVPMLVLIALVFLAAGFVKGISGMGLPTLAMALLGLVMPPGAAASLMAIPALATNLMQCLGPNARMLGRRLWPMWAGLALATVWSPLPDVQVAGSSARLALGLVLVVYGLWGWFKPTLPPVSSRHEALLGMVAGLASGVLTAATGVFVMPMVPFLQALRLHPTVLVQALGLSFTFATLALMLRLQSGVDGIAMAGVVPMGVALATAFAGMGLGVWLRQRWPARVFQRVLYATCLGTGVLLIVRGFF